MIVSIPIFYGIYNQRWWFHLVLDESARRVWAVPGTRFTEPCSLLARVYYDVTWYAFDSMLFTSRCIGATMFIGVIRFYTYVIFITRRWDVAQRKSCFQNTCMMIIIFSNTFSTLISIVTPFYCRLINDRQGLCNTISHINISKYKKYVIKKFARCKLQNIHIEIIFSCLV